MINQTLLWLLALPVVAAIVIWIVTRQYRDAWMFCGAYALVGLMVVCTAFFISKGTRTGDIEIWSGQIMDKKRIHDSYERRYECNCTTTTHRRADGSTYTTKSCQTCTEDHYTVEWKALSTIGEFGIAKEDWTNRGVYRLPDPQRFTIIRNGDPVSKRASYTNYVQAVPNSLFTPASAGLKQKFSSLLPPYPDRIYDLYQIDRFITPGWAPADAAEWNKDIANGLRTIGPAKQVNLIVVVAKTDDPNYEYALRDHWEGVNKNDVVLLIGSTEYPKIAFTRVISWTKNELFKVQLRDVIDEKGVVDRSIIQTALNQISTNFERRKMSEFEYLDGEIDPPDWLVWLIIVIVLSGGGALWWMMPDLTNSGRRYRR